VKHSFLHISGSWPIRVRLLHPWAAFLHIILDDGQTEARQSVRFAKLSWFVNKSTTTITTTFPSGPGWDFKAVSPDLRGLLALFLHPLAGVNIRLNTINKLDQFISINHFLDPSSGSVWCQQRRRGARGGGRASTPPDLTTGGPVDFLQVDPCVCVCACAQV